MKVMLYIVATITLPIYAAVMFVVGVASGFLWSFKLIADTFNEIVGN